MKTLKRENNVLKVTTSNDCIRLRDCFLTIRDKYDKFMDRDEVGGPNDAYEALGLKIIKVSDIWYNQKFPVFCFVLTG